MRILNFLTLIDLSRLDKECRQRRKKIFQAMARVVKNRLSFKTRMATGNIRMKNDLQSTVLLYFLKLFGSSSEDVLIKSEE